MVRVAVVPTAVGLMEAGRRALAAGAIAQRAVTEWRLTFHLHFQTFVACVVSVVSAKVVVYSHLLLMFLLPFQHVGQQTDISGNRTKGLYVIVVVHEESTFETQLDQRSLYLSSSA